MNILKPTDEALYMLLVNHVPMILYAEGQWSAAAEVSTLSMCSIKIHKHTRQLYESLTNNDEGVKVYRELSKQYEQALKKLGLSEAA